MGKSAKRKNVAASNKKTKKAKLIWSVESKDLPLLLLAFDYEVSQVLKGWYLDHQFIFKKIYSFSRDYSKYFSISALSCRSKEMFASPEQKVKSLVFRILRRLPKKIHPIILDFLPEATRSAILCSKADIGILRRTKQGQLQMRIPKYGDPYKNQYLSKSDGSEFMIDKLVAAEEKISKPAFCSILGLPPPVDPSKPHTMVLLLKTKNTQFHRFTVSESWLTVGTMEVPSDALIQDLDDWAGDVLRSVYPDDEERGTDGYCYLHVKDDRVEWRSAVKGEIEKQAMVETIKKLKRAVEEMNDASHALKHDYYVNVVDTQSGEIQHVHPKEVIERCEKQRVEAIEEIVSLHGGLPPICYRISRMQMGEHTYDSDDSMCGFGRKTGTQATKRQAYGSRMELLKHGDIFGPDDFEDLRLDYDDKPKFPSVSKDCCIVDVFPSLEETYHQPARELRDSKTRLYNLLSPKFEVVMDWTKSHAELCFELIAREPRRPEEEYHVFKKLSGSVPHHFW